MSKLSKSIVAALAKTTMAIGASVALISTFATGASATQQLPVANSFWDGVSVSLWFPGSAPPGANNWSCRPSAAHPRPVVLVHGTLENQTDNWQAASATLANNGYCVFALNYGGAAGSPFQALGDIATSAGQLSTFVDKVRSTTGSATVDLVGHSQGGMMPRYYLKNLGGAAKVNALVALAPSSHGTDLNGLTTSLAKIPGVTQMLTSMCLACVQQVVGSDFLKALNTGGDTVPGVHYTVISTKFDQIVTPYATQFLTGSGVTNITIQDGCSTDRSDHLQIPYSPRALDNMLNALDPGHPRVPRCTTVKPAL